MSILFLKYFIPQEAFESFINLPKLFQFSLILTNASTLILWPIKNKEMDE